MLSTPLVPLQVTREDRHACCKTHVWAGQPPNTQPLAKNHASSSQALVRCCYINSRQVPQPRFQTICYRDGLGRGHQLPGRLAGGHVSGVVEACRRRTWAGSGSMGSPSEAGDMHGLHSLNKSQRAQRQSPALACLAAASALLGNWRPACGLRCQDFDARPQRLGGKRDP